jgi:hypothetical protein
VISWDLVSFRDRLCGFRSVSSDLQFSSSAMVAALVRWSFGTLARRLPVCLLQALLRQVLPSSGDGEARTAACLRLVLVFIVVTRRFSDLFVIFITFRLLYTTVDDGSVEFLQKKICGLKL